MDEIARVILCIAGAIGFILFIVVLIYLVVLFASGIVNKWLAFLDAIKEYVRIREDKFNDIREQLNNKNNAKQKLIKSLWLQYKSNAVAVSLVTASIAAALFIVTALILSKCFDFYICNENIVLVFVGILATFIVVTNYAQVVNVKKEFEIKHQKIIDELNKNQEESIKMIDLIKAQNVQNMLAVRNQFVDYIHAARKTNAYEIGRLIVEKLKDSKSLTITIKVLVKKGRKKEEDNRQVVYSRGSLEFDYFDICAIESIDFSIKDYRDLNNIVAFLYPLKKGSK